MNVYVWKKVDGVPSGWEHDSGGLVVVADTLERAREMVLDELGPCFDWPEKIGQGEIEFQQPDAVYRLDGVDEDFRERTFVFPNEGCC